MRPVAPRVGLPETVIAADQHEFQELVGTAYCEVDAATRVAGPITILTRWRLSPEELKRIAAGEDLYLHILTAGEPLQPVKLEVGPPKWAQ